MKNLKLIFCLAGIFVLGGVTGWLLGARYVKEQAFRRANPAQWGPQQLKQFITQLDLSPEQVEKIRPIINQSMNEVRRLERKSRTQTGQLLESMRTQIEPLLTPEQRTKLETMRRQSQERMQHWLQERARRMGELPPPPDEMDRPPPPPHPRGAPADQPGPPDGK